LLGVASLLLLIANSAASYDDSKWQVKYWNNTTLSGTPVLQRQESTLDHNWGENAPAAEVNGDNFSARWTRTVNFSAGTYRFTATMDDGMRLWVDGGLLIDCWYDSQVHAVSGDVYLASGDHQLKVEYYQNSGGAIAKLTWAAVAAPPGVITNWRGEYYNNFFLSGSPALVRDDLQINFNWGVDAPQWNVVQADHFSARWTRNLNLNAGRYRFTTTADDGVCLWVNNVMLIDQWRDQAATTYSAEIDLPGGSIPVKMEYYENNGGAVAQLSWTQVGSPTISNWRGEYFNNSSLAGAPAVVRDDAQLNFNWGNGSPAPGIVGSDVFSVRWTRSLNLHSGRYRFDVSADDGVRLWVNNQLIIDRWYDHAVQAFSGEIDLPGGAVSVKMEYYEAMGLAQAGLMWTPITSTPPATGSLPTAVVANAYYLNVRSGPGVSYSIISVIPRNTVVQLAGYRNANATWVKIILSNGTKGWVNASYLSSTYPFANLIVGDG
jgi:hypothetical protein